MLRNPFFQLICAIFRVINALRNRNDTFDCHALTSQSKVQQSPIKESCANSIYHVTHVSRWTPFCVQLHEFRRIVPLAGWVRAAARKTVRLGHVEVSNDAVCGPLARIFPFLREDVKILLAYPLS